MRELSRLFRRPYGAGVLSWARFPTLKRGANHRCDYGALGTDKSVPYKETHDLTLLDALRPFHPLRVGEAGGALSKQRRWQSFSAA